MLKGRRGYDNVSISKSSKTLKSKLNINPETQIKVFEPPYFKQDPIRRQIEHRVKKQNLKHQGLYTKPKYDHLNQAGRMLEGLFQQHQKAKQRLVRLKAEAEQQTSISCTFQPSPKKIIKYQVPENVIRRNQTWLLEKRRKLYEKTEEKLNQDLTKCTFTPVLLSKRQSSVYLRSRSTGGRKEEEAKKEKIMKKETFRYHADISRKSFESGKRKITDRLYSIY